MERKPMAKDKSYMVSYRAKSIEIPSGVNSARDGGGGDNEPLWAKPNQYEKGKREVIKSAWDLEKGNAYIIETDKPRSVVGKATVANEQADGWQNVWYYEGYTPKHAIFRSTEDGNAEGKQRIQVPLMKLEYDNTGIRLYKAKKVKKAK